MDESFESRPLIDRETLRALTTRRNRPSAVRLVVQLTVLALLVATLGSGHLTALAAAAGVVLLAAVIASVFAPFHESTHRTAFISRRANAIVAWIAGTLWLLAPAVYRVFHFEHHRHTQDPERDPELMGDPAGLSTWPRSVAGWLRLVPFHLLLLKLGIMARCALLPESQWLGFAAWASPEDRRACMRDSRIVLLIWGGVATGAVLGVPGLGWFLLAALLSHAFIGLWLTSEHRGLPFDGTIMARTRTTDSNAFVRWWLWNANYHAEHHAWPALPWHALPAAHALVRPHLEHHVEGYLPLHANVLRQRNRPSCDPLPAPDGR